MHGNYPGVILAVILCLCCTSSSDICKEYKRVCYFTNWSQYRNVSNSYFFPETIDPSQCSHIVYAFASLKNNKLVTNDWNDDGPAGLYARLIALKGQSTGLKILLAVGGWTMGVTEMTTMLSTSTNRAHFITTSINFLRQRNFDGLDLDFEYPANRGSPPQDKERFALLCQELHEAFIQESPDSNNRLQVTAAIGMGKSIIDSAYDVPMLTQSLDAIHMMTYDFHGSWDEEIGHNSPLYPRNSINPSYYNVAMAVDYLVSLGALREKLIVGLPLYGRTFTFQGTDPRIGDTAEPGIAGHYTKEAGLMAYFEVCEKINEGGTVRRLEDEHVPYIVSGNQWIGYDDQQSLVEKVQWLKQQGFGGWMVWSLDLDDFTGKFCNQGPYPLMSAINEALLNGSDNCIAITTSTVRNTDDTIYSTNTVLSTSTATTAKSTTTPPVPRSTTYSTTTTATLSGPVFSIVDSIYATSNGMFTCKNRADGLYTDQTDCHYYYHCFDQGTSIARVMCAEGLAFNGRSCDWALSVTTCGKEYHKNEPAIFGIDRFTCYDKLDGYHSDPTDCHFYYICQGKGTYIFKRMCPVDHAYDSSTYTCVPEDGVASCNQISEGLVIGGLFAPFDGTFTCSGKSDGMYSDPTDCHHYYKCYSEGTSIGRIFCGDSLAFDGQTCTWELAVQECGSEKLRGSPAIFGIDNLSCYKKMDGYYADPTDCHFYYICHGGGHYLFKGKCPDNNAFDRTTYDCASEDSINSCNKMSPVGNSTDTDTGMFTCDDKGDGLYSDLTDCRHYYNCSDNGAYISRVQCADGLTFNGVSCDSTMNNQICDSENQNEKPAVFGIKSFTCYGKVDGYYDDPSDKTYYFVCKDQGKVLFRRQCPLYHVYTNDTDRCVQMSYTRNTTDNTGDVIGSTLTGQLTTLSSAATKNIFSCSGMPDGLFEDPTDCHYYYNCYHNGNSISRMSCDTTTTRAFDVVYKWCDLEENIETCGKEPWKGELAIYGINGFSCYGKADGYYTDPTNCQYYFICGRISTLSRLKCQDNFGFNGHNCVPKTDYAGCQ